MAGFEKKIIYRTKNYNPAGKAQVGPATIYLTVGSSLVPVEVDVYAGMRGEAVALIPTWNQDSCKEGKCQGSSVLKIGPEGELFVDRELVVPFVKQHPANRAPQKTKICLQPEAEGASLLADVYADSEGKVVLLVPQGALLTGGKALKQDVSYYGVQQCSLHFGSAK